MLYSKLSCVLLLACSVLSCQNNKKTSNIQSENTANQIITTPTSKTVDVMCPWSFATHKTVLELNSLGIPVELDCQSLNSSLGIGYTYTQADFDGAMAGLDASIGTLKKSTLQPIKIRLGKGWLHDPKNHLIQIGVDKSFTPSQINQHVDVSLQMMEFENVEFQNQVTFNFTDTSFISKINGEWASDGEQWPATLKQDLLEKEFESLRKFKQNILDHKDVFSRVILFHGSILAQFQIFRDSYYFSSEQSEELNSKFFDYLDKFEQVVQSYSPIMVNAPIYRGAMTGYQADFEKSKYLLDFALSVRNVISSRPIDEFYLVGLRDINGFHSNKIGLSYSEDKRLTMTNVLAPSGVSFDVKLIEKCVSDQDYSKPFSVECKMVQ